MSFCVSPASANRVVVVVDDELERMPFTIASAVESPLTKSSIAVTVLVKKAVADV